MCIFSKLYYIKSEFHLTKKILFLVTKLFPLDFNFYKKILQYYVVAEKEIDPPESFRFPTVKPDAQKFYSLAWCEEKQGGNFLTRDESSIFTKQTMAYLSFN